MNASPGDFEQLRKVERLYAGATQNLYRLEAQNLGKTPLELSESSFYRPGVRAVAFWPRARLAPGEVSAVFVLAERQGAADRGVARHAGADADGVSARSCGADFRDSAASCGGPL